MDAGCRQMRDDQRGRGSRELSPCLPLLGALAVIGGCATTSADFRLSKVAHDEAAIAGRLTIIYNGKAFTENCLATFGGSSIKLSEDGIVLFRVKKGWTQLERLDCKDGSNQHVTIRGAGFFAQGDGWVSDFGDVAIMWQTTGGFKVSSIFGLIGAAIDESSDDGTATVEISSPAAEVREAFRRQTGVDGRWVVQQLTRPSL